MPFPLEAVPNFSEGRNRATIDALGQALSAHAELLDVHSDPDHNRSVFTLVGQEAALIEALLAGIAVACEKIDLRRHDGVHPRIGVADVVPLVAVRPDDLERAKTAAVDLARRVGADLGLPVFLYRESAGGRGPAAFRRRVDLERFAPDFGPRAIDPRAGAVLVGARRPLIAFNVNLRSADIEIAREIAAVVRESGGGFPGVRALGFALPSRGLVQVSMNVEDPEAVSLLELVTRIRAEAAVRGVDVVGSELVGLMPAVAAARAAGAALGLEGFDASRVLELRLKPPR